MKCQKCNVEFEVKEIEGINVNYCPECEGVFLHHGELKKITHETAGDVEYSSVENLDANRLSGVDCPACKNEEMLEINFILYSDIVMGYCRKCRGIWLEKGELKLINKEIDKINMDTENWEHALRVFLSKLPF